MCGGDHSYLAAFSCEGEQAQPEAVMKSGGNTIKGAVLGLCLNGTLESLEGETGAPRDVGSDTGVAETNRSQHPYLQRQLMKIQIVQAHQSSKDGHSTLENPGISSFHSPVRMLSVVSCVLLRVYGNDPYFSGIYLWTSEAEN
uniref:Uncharacterized protein n=1 Tax=Lotharella globosa TaxID=91324 RepID=A0A7S4DW94_9EUKA|mmetsp:Transcript_3576/g.7206  ORF Transcript_3576/g.7206 Transcript_3576/m.7206 type:complete len:143 (+) Transcript_3576:118-546(+)